MKFSVRWTADLLRAFCLLARTVPHVKQKKKKKKSCLSEAKDPFSYEANNVSIHIISYKNHFTSPQIPFIVVHCSGHKVT